MASGPSWMATGSNWGWTNIRGCVFTSKGGIIRDGDHTRRRDRYAANVVQIFLVSLDIDDIAH
jgi:hypothetical protein